MKALFAALLALWSTTVLAQGPSHEFPSVDELEATRGLPDPLMMIDGRRAKTPEDWEQQRAYIRDMLLYYQYGYYPPPPENLEAELISSQPILDGRATETQLVLSMGPDRAIRMRVDLSVPTKGTGPFPVVITGDRAWGRTEGLEVATDRGYMVADFYRTDLDPDDADRTNGVHPHYPDHDWATLSAWAWGYSRVVDYLVTLDNIDRSKIVATGHSRGGKTALLAGAMDTRIAIVVPNGSGAGGCGSYRYLQGGAESLLVITRDDRFHYWFQPRLSDFKRKVDRLPFDQHFLKALVAPRPLLCTDALHDEWANPWGSQQTTEAAREVYEFLGVTERIGHHYRQGGHRHNVEDWEALLDFADFRFFGKPLPGDFYAENFARADSLINGLSPGPTVHVGDRDLQQVIDAAPPHSTIVADRNHEIEITQTITIEKPLTIVGLSARLQPGLARTPILSVTAEGVRIRDFKLTGNADSVPQEDRAPLIAVRRGSFVIENGETNNSAKDGVMITPLPEYGNIEHGVVRNITSQGTIRDTVSIGGAGEQGLFVRHIVVENIRAYDCELRGAVEASDGSEHITIRDVYAESCLYGVDIQDHKKPGQVNRFIIVDGLHVKNSDFAVRTANRDFGHDGLTIRNVTGTEWPADADEPFQVRNTTNVLIDNVRLDGCPVGPCMRIRNSDNVTIRDVTFADCGHDGPALRIEDGNNVLVDGVTISGDAQPQFGVSYQVTSNETFAGLRVRNVLAPRVRDTGIVIENLSESGRLDAYELSGNMTTTRPVRGEPSLSNR